MQNKSLVLLIILLIMAIIPGIVYFFLHPKFKIVALVVLLVMAIIPGVLYLVWPGKGGFLKG
ncbi:hypothetical protein STIUS_v1c05930 [Spiroplasma sp. TIUS-1]|uniref:hypothetical protein n=1 Tax=Spiroplasma sp. TIUS-1 TaxID=216963 RepID=UPI00139936F0|nr:hypothetical protein [Spiroplasma sp. TIUS-1]QHX36147.1 hypothetical protein STIUS_v1c05930 [Spiroplasma sp. TIUS-1]